MTVAAKNPVALVTGASRGAGKGIACALAENGCTVYLTGRSQKDGDSPLPGSVFATAQQITERGGNAIPVVCDHSDDKQTAALFEQIEQQQGRLDILVNNATALHDDLIKPGGFWEKSLELVDILNVGLRSAYVASHFAAKLMVQQGSGLIVNTSSFGGACYMHGPAYGAQKAGLDKMIWDMGHDLKPHQVHTLSLWMGMLSTERTLKVIEQEPEKYPEFAEICESPEFIGHIILNVYQSKERHTFTGKTLIAAELAEQLGITDKGQRQPPSHRHMLGGPLSYNPAIVE